MAGPLARYRVLHLTTNVPGPLAAARLARAGARVTKVEPPSGDALAQVAPGWYESLHQRQKILSLDLKTEKGLAHMEKLLGQSDLFLTTTRPQSLKRLGLDWRSIHRRHPKLSMLQIQGFPSPRENVAAHDLVCQAKAGLLSPQGLPRALIADFAAGERAFSESLLLLIGSAQSRKGARSQKGTCSSVTLQESADAFAEAFR